jgi:hypothetical protein
MSSILLSFNPYFDMIVYPLGSHQEAQLIYKEVILAFLQPFFFEVQAFSIRKPSLQSQAAISYFI